MYSLGAFLRNIFINTLHKGDDGDNNITDVTVLWNEAEYTDREFTGNRPDI
jgi:hypothetical protein